MYRGDAARDQNGDIAFFRDLKLLPSSASQSILWFGLRKGHCVRIADAFKAYLQAPVRSPTPAFVILPREMWHKPWFKIYRKVAARLHKALYGHPTSGDDWAVYFDETLVVELQGPRVESFPSLWWFPSLEFLEDNIVAAGPEKSMTHFWEELSKRITVDTISEPGRYLGRDHIWCLISRKVARFSCTRRTMPYMILSNCTNPYLAKR